ncbi:N-acetylmuramoyl-L-alanine amidase family protein [Cohnella silvisoli]|uniref:N-acetylmuramoyl-L-alanine amidase n=1 Tax=Cohnella silvisoli TaxID=2873699 RepID=A0ABV1KNJ6_9BACL|nr:N-acetylmuramoyl-L-alanine amidase family protein [Cohnella silvisoli]MCD9021095.1 N-acetylmuramoyl-L-alanine amidase family protein [Cohnella silvisoli]
MKKWLSLLFVVSVMLFLSAGIVHAAKSEVLTPKLILDGKTLQPQVAPIVMDKTVMIPVRIATASLGYKVDYDNKKKQVKVSSGSKQLVMTLNKPTAYLDNEPKKMIMPPTSISNNILIPLRFLSESLDVQVFWDNQSKSAFLYSSSSPNPDDTTDTEPPTEGPIGNVDDPNNTDGGGKDPGTVVPPEPTTPTDPVTPPVTPVITGNIHEVRYETDTVVVKYDGLTVPTVTPLDNPKRLVIDLPNAQYATDFTPVTDFVKGTQGKLEVTGHPALQSIRYSLFGDVTKSPRVVLDLNQTWGYELLNDPGTGELRIALKQPTPDKSLFTVVLDAGHGGSDPGAPSISGKWEKDYNISVVLKVQALLATDERIKLVLTRQGDTYPTLADRYNLANSLAADLFVSVHANSYTSATNGTETYYTRADSKEFATLMHSLLIQATGLKDNGVRQKSLAVTRETKMPAVLLESGYLSSKIDDPKLWTDDFQNRVAQAIATGIKQQLKLF